MAYCTVDDVRLYIPRAIRMEGDNPTPDPRDPNPESLTDDEIEEFISQADQYINARIGAIYDIPLRKTNIGGTLAYPSPIPSISARLSAKFIWQKRLAGADRETGNFVDKHYAEAMEELNDVIRGHVKVMGQDSFRSKRFAPSTWYGTSGPSPVKLQPESRR